MSLETFKTDILITLDGWVGMVRDVKSTLALRFSDGSSVVVEDRLAEELEDVTRRSLAALSELLTQPRPRVLPGAGCLEARLALQLPALRRPLLRLALLPGGVEMARGQLDPGTGHLYTGQPGEACQCGLVPWPGDTLVPLLEVDHSTAPYSLHTPVTRAGGGSLVLDSLTFKKASILTAVETAENLSNIGMIITC